MGRLGKIKLSKITAASAVLGICAAVPVYVRMPEQCVLCRAERVEYRIAGISFPTGLKQGGEFTRCYVAHRPPHKHIWRYSAWGCMVERNFFGLVLTVSMMMHHPVLFLKPAEELEFVTLQDEAALSKFFATMASTNLELQLRAYEGARKNLADSR